MMTSQVPLLFLHYCIVFDHGKTIQELQIGIDFQLESNQIACGAKWIYRSVCSRLAYKKRSETSAMKLNPYLDMLSTMSICSLPLSLDLPNTTPVLGGF